MTRIEKLELINKEVQETVISNDLDFFTDLFPEKLNTFLGLTYFPEITHETFHLYLDTYRNGILVDTIKWCKESKLNETEWQKNFTLKSCKESVKSMLRIINWAFEYYIGNKELLLKEED